VLGVKFSFQHQCVRHCLPPRVIVKKYVELSNWRLTRKLFQASSQTTNILTRIKVIVSLPGIWCFHHFC
jgi:hypothetical protein